MDRLSDDTRPQARVTTREEANRGRWRPGDQQIRHWPCCVESTKTVLESYSKRCQHNLWCNSILGRVSCSWWPVVVKQINWHFHRFTRAWRSLHSSESCWPVPRFSLRWTVEHDEQSDGHQGGAGLWGDSQTVLPAHHWKHSSLTRLSASWRLHESLVTFSISCR